MAKVKSPGKIPADFINGLKQRIPINEFYTKLTGIQFTKDNSRLRAKVAWRKDEHPSLVYASRSNTLTDFADQSNYVGKVGKVYNHLDILQATKTCKGFYDSIVYLANYLNEPIPSDMLSAIKHYTRHQEALHDIYQACRNTANAMFAESTDIKQSYMLRAYCKLREIPFEEKFFDLLEIGVWPAKQIVESILKKYDIDTDKKNQDEIGFARFPDMENRAIVFPLYNKQSALVGICARTMEETKQIYRSALSEQTISMYGLNHAITCKNVGIVEGEMNRVQIAARLWDNPELASKAIQNVFCTGSLSGNNKLKTFEGFFDRVIYFPDVQLANPDAKESRSTINNIIDVYNILKVHEFKAIYWPEQRDKYDLDDYLRENKDNGKSAFFALFRSSDFKKSIPEYIYSTIETLVKTFSEESRNSARFSYCERFAKELWNGADQNELRYLYSDLTGVDDELVQQLNDGVFTRIKDSIYYTKNNAYWIEETDKATNVSEKKQISDFVVRGIYRMISMKGRNKPKTEELDSCWENAEIHALIHYSKSKVKKHVIFTVDDLVDYKKFWHKLYSVDINLIDTTRKDREADIFYCAKNTLATPIERFSFPSSGPHIKSFAPEDLKDTLRPDLFVKGGTLKTYLSKYVSVIDGKVVENKLIGVDLSKSLHYQFALCDDATLQKISHTLWTTLRRMHDPLLVDGLIGFALCAPIKHILDANVNGLHLFLLGPSNSHKTSLARIIQNFYGDFATDTKVQAFSNQTPKHLEAAIQATGSCVCVCDEFKPSKEYPIETMNHIIHNIYNGKTRGRLNTKSEMVDINYFNANVITTAEYAQELETSAEARYLRFNVPPINTESIYQEINGPDTLPLFKCFTPYLISWQHQNIEKLIERYNFYRSSIEETIKEEPNKNRISLQLSMILTGFYSFCKFIESKEICTEEEADKAIQRLVMHLITQAKKQVARSTDVRVYDKFKEYLAEGLMTRTMNMAIIEYDQHDKPKLVRYTQQNNTVANVWKYRRNPSDPNSTVYAIFSFRRLKIDLKRGFDYDITDSLKQEFADQLDERGNIKPVWMPDPDNISKNKAHRAIIIPTSTIHPEGINDDREPEGF
jgi:hypothetical protein